MLIEFEHDGYHVVVEGTSQNWSVQLFPPDAAKSVLSDSVFAQIFNMASDRVEELVNGNPDRLYDEMKDANE